MLLKMFAVRDRSAGFYFPPFFARSDVEALRMFERLMKDPNRSGAVSEYDLVYMLDFSDGDGDISGLEREYRVLCNGSDFEVKS